MNSKHTITINGRLYDAQTGLIIDDTKTATKKTPQKTSVKVTTPTTSVRRDPAQSATNIHRKNTQKSETLRRQHLTAPKSTAPVVRSKRHVRPVAQSPMITRFAKHPKPLPKTTATKIINDIGPMIRKNPPAAAKITPAPLTSHELKEKLIAQASQTLEKTVHENSRKPVKTRPSLLNRLRIRHFAAAAAAVVILAGYLAYLNVPSISVRVAAAQSGVNAKYPTYNPDGYSFHGPVAYEPGSISMTFTANGGGDGYTIREENSDWNSGAVLDNLVASASNNNYRIYSEGGITIYTYGTNAAWTNGGILYKISGQAPLSPEQLQRIASSM